MKYTELASLARGKMGACKACPVCDGRACKNAMPGPGAKGTGTVAIRNYDAWQQVRLLMDTLHEPFTADTTASLFGRTLALPVMVAPVGNVGFHYSADVDMGSYNETVLGAARAAGTLAWTGDGPEPSIHEGACRAIGALGGAGVCTIKPWDEETLEQRLETAFAVQPAAIAMDVDAVGLLFLRASGKPAAAKDTAQLRRIADACHNHGIPFIIKGVMTLRAAEKAVKAGVDGIVVSNHGGRVLDGVAATAEVLPAIADEFEEELTILVDGGIRSGVDVFRALALGAEGVLMCRPFVVCMFGGGADGVSDYLRQLQSELADTMEMCGAATVADISRDMVL